MLDLTIYAIAGPQDYPTNSIEVAFEKMSHVIESGVTVFQYRDKGDGFSTIRATRTAGSSFTGRC